MSHLSRLASAVMYRLFRSARRHAAEARSLRRDLAQSRTACDQAADRNAELRGQIEDRDAELRGQIEDRDETIRQLHYDVAVLTGECEILKSQLGMFEAWRAREQEWHEAQAAIESARKMAALGGNGRLDERTEYVRG